VQVAMTTATDFNRSISNLFTNSVFKEIAETGTSDYWISKAKKYSSQLELTSGMLIKDTVSAAYKHLGKNYRNEYLYKNSIANKILLGKHNLQTATMLSEFKVANSIADVVILNGTSSVYEIKTELDTSEKLRKQIIDYKKAFAKVYIVTHYSLVDKYSKLLTNETVGLIALTQRLNFKIVKEATEDYSQMENEVILKCLRKEEYTSIITDYFGRLPSVSNIHFFKECLKLFNSIEIITLHNLMLIHLAKRKPSNIDSLVSSNLPNELKHICICIDPTHNQYQKLFSFLYQNI
jgi:hypothetical protein